MNFEAADSSNDSTRPLTRKGYIENPEIAHDSALIEAPYHNLKAQYDALRPTFEDYGTYHAATESFKAAIKRGIRDVEPLTAPQEEKLSKKLRELSDAPQDPTVRSRLIKNPELAHESALIEAPYRTDRARLAEARKTVGQPFEEVVDYDLLDTYLLRRGHLAANAILSTYNSPKKEETLRIGVGRRVFNGREQIHGADMQFSENILKVLKQAEGDDAALSTPLPTEEEITEYKFAKSEIQREAQKHKADEGRRRIAETYQRPRDNKLLDTPHESLVPYFADRELEKDEIPGYTHAIVHGAAEALFSRSTRATDTHEHPGRFWNGGRLLKSAELLTDKFHGKILSLKATTLPVDEEFVSKFLSTPSLKGNVNPEDVARIRVLAELKSTGRKPFYSYIDYVVYVADQEDGPFYNVAIREKQRTAAKAAVSDLIEDSSSIANTIADNAQVVSGGLPSLGKR